MADNQKTITYDIDGYAVMSSAINALLNQFPGLYEGERINFSDIKKDSGIAWYPISGPVVESVKAGTYETGDITGHVSATCQYPFYLVYRIAPTTSGQRIEIKEWLDTLGRWLEKKPVKINGQDYLLEEYPIMEDTRTITSITRQTASYLDTTSEDGVQDWAIYLALKYLDEFDR